jgi:Flp pilus assembly protein TadG
MKARRRGSALIEFAGSLILLSGVFAGIFQIGYTLFAYDQLVHAVRAAARYASLRAGSPNTSEAQLTTAVQNLVTYGDPAPAASAKALIPGLTNSTVELSLGPATATVSVRGFKLDSVFSEVKLDGRPTATFPVTNGVGE